MCHQTHGKEDLQMAAFCSETVGSCIFHLLTFKMIKTTERQAQSLRIVFKTHVEELCRGVPFALTQHRFKV